MSRVSGWAVRSLVRASIVALSLAGCHQPEEPPPIAPKPIDPVNMRLVAGTRSLAQHETAVIDASIVSEGGHPFDGWSFDLDAGSPLTARRRGNAVGAAFIP